MTTVLIPTMSGDSDSLFVSAALEERGVNVIRWIGDHFPRRQVSSFRVSNFTSGEAYLNTDGINVKLNIDVVWLRRPRFPILPDYLDPRDKEMAMLENRAYITSLFESLGKNATWANTLAGRRRANSKIAQLQDAQTLGMLIPETLISNDPKEIKSFLNPKFGSAIVKPMYGGEWIENGKRIFTYTSEIAIENLPSDAMIQACPCIYQRKINKKFEARVVFFGAHAIAVKLDSQRSKTTIIDWRIGDARDLNIEEISIPENVKNNCILLMRELGIIHGSFDFSIDQDGQWTFFEVNEQGQFLWMENFVPHLPVLDTVTQFLTNPSPDFTYFADEKKLSMRETAKSDRFIELSKLEQQSEKYNSEKIEVL